MTVQEISFLSKFFSVVGVTRSLQDRRDAKQHKSAMARYELAQRMSDAELDEAIAAALSASRDRPISRRDEEEQMVNFVWGNTLEDNTRTKSTVRRSLNLA
jgi:hypothetical protein